MIGSAHWCDHRGETWILGNFEWCRECGAIRELRRITGTNVVRPVSAWLRAGDNYVDWQKRSAAYRKRMKIKEGGDAAV